MSTSSRLERLLDIAPANARTVREAARLVWEDLPPEGELYDLLRSEGIPADLEWSAIAAGRDVPRIRPLLVALSARAAGAGEVDRDVAQAAEVLHLALTVHDVALGRAGGRRRRAARRIFDRSASWLGGNHLTLRALELVRSVPDPAILGEVVETLRAFSDAQVLGNTLQAGAPPTSDDWLEHADTHTGALFAFCCRAGGMLGDGEAGSVSALGRYGRHLGRAWHIAEDVAMLTRGDGVALLLERGECGRPVLPVIEAMGVDPWLARDWARIVVDGDEDAAKVVADAAVANGLVPARRVLLRESWAARKVLRTLEESTYRTGLDRIAADLASVGR